LCDVSIIIVNYNTRQLLYNCLISIYRETRNIDFEIIVSDNGSTDGSIEMLQTEFSGVVVIKNNANIGFGPANNKGLDIATGKYIFYLNSDTILLNNAVKTFYDYWENYYDRDNLGALGCNLINEKFEIIHSYGKFPQTFNTIKYLIYLNLKLFIKTIFYLVNYDYQYFHNKIIIQKYIGEVDYITGADLFVKKDEIKKYDEMFFLFYEETDLQYQMYSAGKKRLLIDGPIIQHLKGGSNKARNNFEIYASFSVIQSYISCILFFRKNFPIEKNRINIIKFFTILLLCNPFLIKKTYKYIYKVISI
jgi:GT2 family glycosyltransferase